MADDQNPTNPSAQNQKNNQNGEADASDLLSLWGGASQSAPAPQQAAVPPPQATPEAQPEPPEQPEPKFAQPEPKPETRPSQPPELEPEAPVPQPSEAEEIEEPQKPIEEEPAAEEEEVLEKVREPEQRPEDVLPWSTAEEEGEINEEETHIEPAETPAAEKIEPEKPEVIVQMPEEKKEEAEFLEEKESFGTKFSELLQELHISKKQIFYGCGCIIILIALVFGGIRGYKYFKNRGAPPPSKAPAQISAEETGLKSTGQIGSSAMVTPDLIGDTGIFATSPVGTEFEGVSDIANYLMIFRRMQNAYATDINELLNKSTDRRSTLLSYLALIQLLNEEGSSTLQNIIGTEEIISSQYEEQIRRRDTDDVNFFEQVNAYNAKTAQNILEDFIEASKEIVELRAHFKALQKIHALFEQGLPKMANRIAGIALNQDALISGIKVYEVRGADLDLIVPVNGEQIPRTDRLQDFGNERGTGLLPSNPAQITTENDYIMQPGGGFENYRNNSRLE